MAAIAAYFYLDCGGAGMGLHAKLSQNMILGNLLQAFNESLVLSTKAGGSARDDVGDPGKQCS